ncbi:MAG: LamG domain-containing protein, partial [Flavobacteriales bacterium]|nr:LamG domain-containing protein [Flavobacteriales bacterium]
EPGTGVTLEIYTTSGGIPDFEDDPIDVTFISDPEIPLRADGCSVANFDYVFAPGEVTLLAGQQYALVCKSGTEVSWRLSTTDLDGIDPYPFGDAMSYQPNKGLGDPQLNVFEEYDLGFIICERAMSEDWGCTDSAAENYNPTAIFDDGSCEFQARSLHFDGEDDYIVIPADATTDFSSSDFSVEGWIKIDTSVEFSAPISAFNFDLGGWALEVYYQKIRFMHGNTGLEGDFDHVACIDSLDLNVWYHIAAVRQGNELRMYIDGNLQGTTISNRIIPYPNMLLGRLYTNTNNFYFPGCVDEVRLWNYALTEEEVMASMQCELAGDETGLVRYYHLNQGLAGADNSSVTILESNHVNNPVDGTLLNFTLDGPTSNWVTAPLMDQCAVICLGDFNGDQEVSTPDLLILLGGIGCTESPCIGDLNNSGTTDTADLLLFLALFGTSC